MTKSPFAHNIQLARAHIDSLFGPDYPTFNPVAQSTAQPNSSHAHHYYWEKLSKGGKTVQCGWLKDKYGLSWQIIPDTLGKLLADKDPQKTDRVYQAMMKMTKIDIKKLKHAYNQK